MDENVVFEGACPREFVARDDRREFLGVRGGPLFDGRSRVRED
jgi:hypothetical protein